MSLRELAWMKEGTEMAAWDNNVTLVEMVANIFGKDPKPLNHFQPYKEER